jgi:hypothetical protein
MGSLIARFTGALLAPTISVLCGAAIAAAKPLNPCTLVTAREVQTIAHRHVTSRIEAPLGPTCIYKLGDHREITLAVEAGSFSQRVSQLHRRKRVTIRGRPGYCGVVGGPTLYVEVRHGWILDIAAECGVATKMAAKALARLKR